MGRVRIGILGCAGIAEKLIRGMLLLPEIQITALGSRSLTKAQGYAAKNHIPVDAKLYDSYDGVLDDPNVDAVYIPLPTGLHLEWVTKAAEKKKHVLLEKPVSHTIEELDAFLGVIDRNHLQFMDGTMFMHHPRLAQMHQVLHNRDVVGDIQEVIAMFITNLGVQPGWTSDIRGQPHLDGLGCLGDIGWYCTRFVLWAYDFQMPKTVTAHPGSKLSDTGVLTSCGASFEWPDGRMGTFRCSFLGDMVMKAICVGSKGTLEIDDFVIPRQEDVCSYRVKEAATWQDRSIGWGAREEVHQVMTSLPQEALMVQEFARLVGGILDGTGKPEPLWSTIARNTQILLNAVKASIESYCQPITL
ncbi:uncharacterized oxidoreductase At4g09670 [Physcomitrium patens]|uniref:Gfo/Idh/MocA-like oxidoreductase N-terminal domain-containing protein n=1 Tax=Physcomitrium patens TaxID=3218 RepID=A9TAR5_PHYPA|nr:uncharacterized oxidoreductase At4g09670-like [Physcomitrium patens]PNR52562.1 hypothetical protein PHYPA_008936 [Physcomitrium patens]|eukprot:XP_024379457.1 uncharacterized oxidoreductase At4g09670-like [Physcomitrella patens]